MPKSIRMQLQRLGSNVIPPTRELGWFSATVDNIKISIDAYKNGSGYADQPRTDCLMEIADKNEVFETTPEQLLQIIRFYIAYSSDKDAIVHYKNTYHYITPDALKGVPKG